MPGGQQQSQTGDTDTTFIQQTDLQARADATANFPNPMYAFGEGTTPMQQPQTDWWPIADAAACIPNPMYASRTGASCGAHHPNQTKPLLRPNPLPASDNTNPVYGYDLKGNDPDTDLRPASMQPYAVRYLDEMAAYDKSLPKERGAAGSSGSEDAPSRNDAGTSGNDAGTSGNDARTYENEAGTYENDAGTYENDAGTYENDAGTSGNDAGSSKKEAGISGNGAGTSGNDAGTSGNDAGTSKKEGMLLALSGMMLALPGMMLALPRKKGMMLALSGKMLALPGMMLALPGMMLALPGMMLALPGMILAHQAHQEKTGTNAPLAKQGKGSMLQTILSKKLAEISELKRYRDDIRQLSTTVDALKRDLDTERNRTATLELRLHEISKTK
uniref:Uncharacterized protein n=1 Tax=Branchiostoma floridae TaxID=7739 RepID=C3ZNY7_BRAFL|eukprot:XP_002589711.1 hypothetical protein BRAFLDRAFT_100837 [Branchiostoma floridae]